jgi:hypothetical protein
MIARRPPVFFVQAITFLIVALSLLKPYCSVADGAPTNSTPIQTEKTPSGQSLKLDQAKALQIRMFGDPEFLEEQYSFAPADKVYLVLEFDQLEAGEHHLSILWKAPDGQLINTARHTISLTEEAPRHRSFFWLRLMKNGFFSEMFTGKEYKGEIHGQWEAEIYFDGARITTQHFMIYQ